MPFILIRKLAGRMGDPRSVTSYRDSRLNNLLPAKPQPSSCSNAEKNLGTDECPERKWARKPFSGYAMDFEGYHDVL